MNCTEARLVLHARQVQCVPGEKASITSHECRQLHNTVIKQTFFRVKLATRSIVRQRRRGAVRVALLAEKVAVVAGRRDLLRPGRTLSVASLRRPAAREFAVATLGVTGTGLPVTRCSRAW